MNAQGETWTTGKFPSVLLPCPFCGAGACFFDCDGGEIIGCSECGAESPPPDDGFTYDTADEAIAAWNTRAHALSCEKREQPTTD